MKGLIFDFKTIWLTDVFIGIALLLAVVDNNNALEISVSILKYFTDKNINDSIDKYFNYKWLITLSITITLYYIYQLCYIGRPRILKLWPLIKGKEFPWNDGMTYPVEIDNFLEDFSNFIERNDLRTIRIDERVNDVYDEVYGPYARQYSFIFKLKNITAMKVIMIIYFDYMLYLIPIALNVSGISLYFISYFLEK